MDPTVAATLARWRMQVRFPGRVVGIGLLPDADARVPADQALAAGVGAALAEAPVAGRVLVAIDRARLRAGPTLAAAALASAVQLDNLALVVRGGTRADGALLAGMGWRIDAALAEGDGPVATLVPASAAADSVATPSSDASAVEPAARPGSTSAHPPAPVRLASLGAWRRSLTIGGGDAFAAVDGWLDALAAREPRLVLPHRIAAFVAPLGIAPLAAIGELAGRGRRVAWRLPRGSDLVGALPALRQLGERRIAATLVVHADDLPPLGAWSCAPAWWVAAPLGDGEAVAVLARALASEAACVVALGGPGNGSAIAWPPDADHEAGTGRALATMAEAVATICCASAMATTALDAHAALAGAGVATDVLLATSLRPLPIAALGDAARRGPLIVVESRLDEGFADAVRAACADARVVDVPATARERPSPGDVAQAVRRALMPR